MHGLIQSEQFGHWQASAAAPTSLTASAALQPAHGSASIIAESDMVADLWY